MRPSKPDPKEPDDLFRARLSQQLDMRHPLVRLAGLLEWGGLETRFGPLYHPHVGRPGIPIRLMVGLSYLQHTFGLSDEEVVARWVENPYWQYFCGFDYLQLALPIDPSSLVRWRQRVGQDGIEFLLQETIAAAKRAAAVKEQSLARVSVDTTVQPKAIAHPLDSRLYHRGREILARLAQRHGVPLRQSYARLGKRALRLAGRYAHARQMKRAKREIKRLKTYLGRVFRDVRRKLEARPQVADHFAEALTRVARLLAQRRTDHNKLYALHAPEVACIAKGKAHKKYEFGAKVTVAVTNREGLVVGMRTHAGNPYDGRTLAPALDQVTRLTGTTPERCYVDRGYRGHGVSGDTEVFIAGRRRGITPTIRRELRRRSAIEAMIGHMKLDGKLARNHLTGALGDAIHALLCGAGHNLRLILRHLARLLRALSLLLAAAAQTDKTPCHPAWNRLIQGRLASGGGAGIRVL
jgi:transposase, IS5 family